MMSHLRARNGAFAFTALAALALSAPAARAAGTITVSPTAPTTDAFDVFQPIFNTPADPDQHLFGSDYLDAAGPPGQRFTTGAFAGQRLLSITVKGEGSPGNSFNAANDFFGMRVSTLTGTTLTPIFSETALSSAVPDDTLQYITFTFSAPITLAANTTYGFDMFSSRGYLPLAKNFNGTGGAFNDVGSNRNFNSTTIAFQGTADRTFYANVAQVVAVPEPGTFALGLMGLVGGAPLAARRLRARRK